MPSGWRRCWPTSPAASAAARRRRALLGRHRADQTHLLVVCTAERGLCGAFNSSIVRLARERADCACMAQGKTVKIICVGKKGYDKLRRQFEQQHRRAAWTCARHARSASSDAERSPARSSRMFEAGEFDVCTLFFSRFRSVIAQIPTAQRLIPAEIARPRTGGAGDRRVYEFEPGEDEILAALLPRNIAVQIFRALLENAASEQGARMSAMDNATRNAGEMIKKQTLSYNRTRQAMITKELIEIISGAEAL